MTDFFSPPPNADRDQAVGRPEEEPSTPRGREEFIADVDVDATMPISTSLALLAAIRASRSCS